MSPWGEGPCPGGKGSPSWPESRPPNPPASHRGSPSRAAPGGPTCFVGHTASCHPPTQVSTPHPYTHPSIGVSTNTHRTLRGPGHGPGTGDPREHSRPHESTSPARTGDWGMGGSSGAGLGSLLGSHLSSSSAPGCPLAYAAPTPAWAAPQSRGGKARPLPPARPQVSASRAPPPSYYLSLGTSAHSVLPARGTPTLCVLLGVWAAASAPCPPDPLVSVMESRPGEEGTEGSGRGAPRPHAPPHTQRGEGR